MLRLRRLSATRSFTLLELMVTSAILIISIAGLLSVYVNSLVSGEVSRETVIAANDAQYVLEQIKSVAFADIEDYSPPTLNNLPDEDIDDPTVTDISTRVKQVTVVVTWTGRNSRPRTFSLTTRFFGEG